MSKKTNPKNILESIELLESFLEDQFCTISKPDSPIDKKLATLKKLTPKNYNLVFEDIDSFGLQLGKHDHIDLQTTSFEIHVRDLFVNSISGNTVSSKIGAFQTKSFVESEKCYYRLIIPLPKKFNLTNFFTIHPFQVGSLTSFECTRMEFFNKIFDAYQYKNKTGLYLVLDSQSSFDLKEFSEYCYSILIGLGFITGYFPQNDGYFFTYGEPDSTTPKDLIYRTYRNTIEYPYPPIYDNPHGFIRDIETAKAYEPEVRGLKPEEFSELVSKIHAIPELASCLILLIEGSASSLEVMPSAISVALETLTNLICSENEDKLTPISNKGLAKELRKEIIKLLDDRANEIGETGLSILKTKIQNLNGPTNRDKLVKPFEILEIKLSKLDINCIEHRNDFLHGRFHLKEIQNKDQ